MEVIGIVIDFGRRRLVFSSRVGGGKEKMKLSVAKESNHFYLAYKSISINEHYKQFAKIGNDPFHIHGDEFVVMQKSATR